MARRLGSICAGLVLVAALAFGLPAPSALACDAPGVSCSSEEAPPAAPAPAPEARCEAPSAAAARRPPAGLVPLNPNGYNQRDVAGAELADVLRGVQRERRRALAEAAR